MFRLFLKNKDILKKNDGTALLRSFSILNSSSFTAFHFNSPYFQENPSNPEEEKFELLKIKDLILRKNLIDIKTYEEIINIYFKQENSDIRNSHRSLPEKEKKGLKVITMDPEFLKLPNQQKYLHEEVFIMNILEKAESSGLKSLNQSEISQFQDIISRRKAHILSVNEEILEFCLGKERNSHKKFATLINTTAETEYTMNNNTESLEMNSEFNKKGIFNRNYAGKRTQSTGNLVLDNNKIVLSEPNMKKSEISEFLRNMADFPEENDETIHKNKGFLIKRREKLRPLTLNPQDYEESTKRLFGNQELEELNYRLEAAKKQLFERLDLVQIKEELENLGSNFMEIGKNKKYRPSIKRFSVVKPLEENKKEIEETKEKKNVSIMKMKPFLDFVGLSGKLKEKSLHLNENIEKRPKNYKDIEEKIKDFIMKSPEIIEEESPKDSMKDSNASIAIKENNDKKSPIFQIHSKKPLEDQKESDYFEEKDEKTDKLREIRERLREKNKLILENLKKKILLNEKMPQSSSEKATIDHKGLKVLIPDSLKRESIEKPENLAKVSRMKPEKPEKSSKISENPYNFNEISDISPGTQLISPDNLIETPKENQPKKSLKKMMRKGQVAMKISTIKPKKASNFSENQLLSPEELITPNKDNLLRNSTNLSPNVKILLNNQTILSQKLGGIDQLKQLFTVKIQDSTPKIEGASENSISSKKNSLNRQKNSSFSKNARKKMRKTMENVAKEEENGRISLDFKKKTTLELEFTKTEDIIIENEGLKSNREEDLDKLLLQDMASLDKKTMRIQQYMNRASVNMQNSSESLNFKNQGFFL